MVPQARSLWSAPETRLNVLVLDAQPERITDLLRDDHNVYAAPSLGKAIEFVNRYPIQLMVVGHRLGDFPGMEFINLTLERLPHCTRILIVDSQGVDGYFSAVQCGKVHGCLVRPWDEAQFRLVMEQALGHARLQREKANLERLVSPALRPVVGETRVCRAEITALFFDLRGSSMASCWAREVDQERSHYEYLRRLMDGATRHVLAHGGTIIDFSGDGLFACWGAPVAQPDDAARAAEAAASIAGWLADQGHQPQRLCGIGLATGMALTGSVSIAGLLRYQVRGACVNLASRLEGLTKYWGLPVLMCPVTRERAGLPSRRLCRVCPTGFPDPIDLYELILPERMGGSGVSTQDDETYQSALAEFEEGRADKARQLLLHLPEDPAARYLLQASRVPSYDGIVRFQGK